MEYLSVAEARALPGLRLVLSAGAPGPWGEAAKKIFEVKGIEYRPVAQLPAAANPELVAWTGRRDAPVAVFEDEAPRDHWYAILQLAERLAPEPALLPADPEQRLQVVGIANEIAGEGGFGWWRRMTILAAMGMVPPPDQSVDAMPPRVRDLARAYGVTPTAVAAAPGRAAAIMTMLAARLHAQAARGSPYFVGAGLTACDLYWACFTAMLAPLPPEANPMPENLRALYADIGPVLEAALDPVLIRHRDLIFERHLSLPLDF